MQPAVLTLCVFISTFRGVSIDRGTNEVSRRDLSGRLLWSVRLEGYLGRHREPHDQYDAERLYLSHNDGVTALDMKTGKQVWHTKGPNDRMLLSGDLLLATECGVGEPITTNGRWVTARTTKTGEEVFRVRLPTERFEALPIREITGLFLVQKWGGHGGLLFDRQGRIFHRFDREVVDGRMQGEERVFLTSRDVICLSAEGKTLWLATFEHSQSPAAGGLVSLPGGDLVAFLYCQIMDGGVQVMRLDPCKGKVVWQASCADLGVRHSAYEHKANVTVEEGQVKVNSQGSGGKFVECLDLGTGQQLTRNVSKR
jgi:outer membrane protein assembly factor BamB